MRFSSSFTLLPSVINLSGCSIYTLSFIFLYKYADLTLDCLILIYSDANNAKSANN